MLQPVAVRGADARATALELEETACAPRRLGCTLVVEYFSFFHSTYRGLYGLFL